MDNMNKDHNWLQKLGMKMRNNKIRRKRGPDEDPA